MGAHDYLKQARALQRVVRRKTAVQCLAGSVTPALDSALCQGQVVVAFSDQIYRER